MTHLTSHLLYPVCVEPTFHVPHTIVIYVLIWTDLACQPISIFIVCFGLGNLFPSPCLCSDFSVTAMLFNAVVGQKHKIRTNAFNHQVAVRNYSIKFIVLFMTSLFSNCLSSRFDFLTKACEHNTVWHLNAPTWGQSVILNVDGLNILQVHFYSKKIGTKTNKKTKTILCFRNWLEYCMHVNTNMVLNVFRRNKRD